MNLCLRGRTSSEIGKLTGAKSVNSTEVTTGLIDSFLRRSIKDRTILFYVMRNVSIKPKHDVSNEKGYGNCRCNRYSVSILNLVKVSVMDALNEFELFPQNGHFNAFSISLYSLKRKRERRIFNFSSTRDIVLQRYFRISNYTRKERIEYDEYT